MLKGTINALFIALGIAAIAVGIYGSFATAFVDGFTAPLVVLPSYVALVAGCTIILCTVFFRQLGWASRALIVVLVVMLIVFASPFLSLFGLYTYPGVRLHFLRDLPQYSRFVAALPHNGKRFAEFNWGGMLFASDGIVYDETDEVALPYGHQSPQWRARMRNTDLTCGGDGPVGAVEPMGAHYYYTGFGC